MNKQSVFLLLLFSGLLFNVRAFSLSKTDTLSTNGQDFIQNLVQPYVSKSSNFSRVFFASDLHDVANIPQRASIIRNCTEQPVILPKFEFSFDTLEYFIFQNSANLTFKDSLQFLQSNMLFDRWHRIYSREDGFCTRVEKLGIDINIDFGKVLSTTYYTDESICYITDSCLPSSGQKYIRMFIRDGERWLESSYLVYKDYVIRTVAGQ